MKKAILNIVAFALFFLILGFFNSYHVPQIKKWIRNQITLESDQNLPVRLLISDVGFSLFPLGIEFKDLQALPKGELAKQIAPLHTERIVVGLHFLGVLTGSRNIIDVTAIKPQLTVIQKKQKTETNLNDYNFNVPIADILRLPFHNITITNSLLRFKSEEADIATEISGLDISADNTGKAISVQLQTPEFRFKKQDLSSKLKKIALEFQGVVDLNTIQISSLKIQRGESTVIGAGFFEGNVKTMQFTNSSLKGRMNLDIEEALIFAGDYIKKYNLPKLSGLLDTSLQFTKTTDTNWTGSAQLRTKELSVNQFKIGEITTEFKYENSAITFPEIQIVNPAGEIKFEKPNFDFKDHYNFNAIVEVKSIEIAQLMLQMGLPKIPVVLYASGKVPCKGSLKPTLSMECSGALKGTDFRVFDKDHPNQTVVALKEFKLEGLVKVDDKGVFPKADISIGTSKGFGEGEILYKSGFNFRYSTQELDFKDVENLANLKFEGVTEIKGTTKGNSDYAIVDMDVKTKDFWFEDFAIGSTGAKIEYRAGDIFLKNIKGNYRTSQFLGNVQVNIPKKRVKASIQSPLVELNDLQRGLARKTQLPFDAYGVGSGQVEVEGPLEFTQLTYKVQSKFNQGFIGPESYDQATFNVTTTNGNAVSDEVELIKGPGRMTLTGKGFPSGQIDLAVAGRGLLIEDFQSITDKGVGLTGGISFNMTLKGHIFKPNILFTGETSRVLMGNQPLQDSKAEFRVTESSLEGKAEFIGDRIKMDFVFPLDEHQPFKLVVNTQKWNFAPLFSLISPTIRQQNYDTELTANIKLESEKGGYKKSSGLIHVSEFRVRRNALQFRNVQPLVIKLNNGGVDIDRFVIRGDNTDLRAESKSSTPGASVVAFGGNIDMSLLSFLTPFLQELRGILSFKSQIRLSDDLFSMQGSAFIDRAYAQLKDFPHAIEQLRADILFTESRISINSATANFAGGHLNADGSIRIEGYKKFPTAISLRLEDTTMRVPQGVAARGSGSANITGQWFPFMMEGNYTVMDGMMDRQFQPDQQNVVRRSSYLPKVLLQDAFDPVEFNIQTHISGTYLVKNALVDTAVTGNLLIKGTPSNPALLGEIRPVKGGQIFFRDTPFTIATGLVRFDSVNDVNPYIFGSATARVKSREYDTSTSTSSDTSKTPTVTVTERTRTRDYDVNLLVQGRKNNLKITLTSQPPLEEYDIISLLALGVTSQQLEKRQSGDQATDLGSAILSQNLALKNKLFDVKISSSSAAEDTNVGDSKVTLSRQWTPKVSTSVGRTLRTNVTDAKLKYDLNDNLAAILNWEGRQQSEDTNQQTKKPISDVLGVGLEYGVEFK